MSDRSRQSRPAYAPVRLALVGATGLIGRRLIQISSAGDEARIVGIARREAPLPPGARMEMFVASPDKWGEVFEAVRPASLICALGTTMKKVGGDQEAFRAVDQELVVETAKAAHAAGISNMVLVSAAGADPFSKNFYLRIKGETEALVSKIGIKRLDILRPGLLRGARPDDFRLAERVALLLSPIVDPLLPERYVMYRTVDPDLVAEAALGLSLRKAAGRFVHDNEAMRRAAREWHARCERAALEAENEDQPLIA